MAFPFLRKHSHLAAGVFLFVLSLSLSLAHIVAIDLESDGLLAGDAVIYDRGGTGVSELLSHPVESVGRLRNGEIDAGERAKLGLEKRYNGGLLRSPTYCVFLGVVYLASGHDRVVLANVQALLVASTVLLTYLLGRQFLGVRSGFVAGVIAATYTSFISFTPKVLTESLALFLLVSTVALLAQVVSRRGLGWPLAAGCSVALLGLCKITYQWLIPVLLLILVGESVLRRDAGFLRRVALFVLGVGLVLGPWLVVSDLIYGEPLLSAPRSTETAYPVYRGNYAPEDAWENDGSGDYRSPELREAGEEAADGDWESGKVYLEACKKAIQNDPGAFAILVLRKAYRMWQLPAEHWPLELGRFDLPAQLGWHRLLVVLGAVGIGLAMRSWRILWFAPLFLVYVTAVHSVTHVGNRYTVPLMPIVILLAVAVLAYAFRKRRRIAVLTRMKTARVAVGALLVSIALALLLDLGRLHALFGNVASEQLLRISILLRVLPLVAAGRLLYLAHRAGRRKGGAIWASVLPVLVLGATWAGSRAGETAWREWSCRLDSSSQRVVQEIVLPSDFDSNLFASAALQIDMLARAGSRSPIRIEVNGVRTPGFPTGLSVDRSKFVYSRDTQRRNFRKPLKTLEGGLGNLDLGPEVGLEYFRQWHTIPIDLDRIRGTQRVRIEVWIEPVDGEESYLEIFGDYPESTDGEVDSYYGPSFARSLYHTSAYKFRANETNRRKADMRLYFRTELSSESARSTWIDGPGGRENRSDLSDTSGRQSGQYRIRLDLRLKGGHYFRHVQGDVYTAEWVLQSAPGLIPIRGTDLQRMESQKDLFFDGHEVY